MLARDNGFWQIFHHCLHYEGSAALWHFLLHTLILLHVPYAGLGWFAAGCATLGVAVWLRWSPLPLVARVLIPLGFWIQYQYAVVARSYVLFPLLLFGLCAVMTRKQPRPWLFVAVAVLLANVCMQGLLISVVFTGVYVFTSRRRRSMPGVLALSGPRKLIFASTLCLGWALALYPAIPAPDVGFVMGTHVDSGLTHSLLLKMIGNDAGPKVAVEPADLLLLHTHPPLPPRPAPGSSLRERLGWQLRVPPESSDLGTTTASVLLVLVELLSKAFWPLATSSLLAAAFLISLLVWARRRKGLVYLLPAFALWLFGEFLWGADHHAGLYYLVLLAGVWLVHAYGAQPASKFAVARPERIFLGLLTLVVALQLAWTAHAISADRRSAYDPSAQTAAFLKAQPPATRIAAFHFCTTGVQPYFARSPFFNVPNAWWAWNREHDIDNTHTAVIASHPDLVVYSYEQANPGIMGNQIMPLTVAADPKAGDGVLLNLYAAEYRETHRFCGDRFSRASSSFRVCMVIFEPQK